MVFRCWEGLRVREGLDVTPQHRIWAGSWSREADFSLQYGRFPAARPARPHPLQAPHHSCAAPAGQHCAQSHLILSLSQLTFSGLNTLDENCPQGRGHRAREGAASQVPTAGG